MTTIGAGEHLVLIEKRISGYRQLLSRIRYSEETIYLRILKLPMREIDVCLVTACLAR